MNKILYHVFTRQGFDRTLQKAPDPSIGEYVVAVKITIPDEIFQQRPIPIVEVVLKSSEVRTADVIVDGEPVHTTVDESARKQGRLQQEFGLLFQAARQSPDEEMRRRAEAALEALLEEGVDVRIVTQLEDEEGD